MNTFLLKLNNYPLILVTMLIQFYDEKKMKKKKFVFWIRMVGLVVCVIRENKLHLCTSLEEIQHWQIHTNHTSEIKLQVSIYL